MLLARANKITMATLTAIALALLSLSAPAIVFLPLPLIVVRFPGVAGARSIWLRRGLPSRRLHRPCWN